MMNVKEKRKAFLNTNHMTARVLYDANIAFVDGSSNSNYMMEASI